MAAAADQSPNRLVQVVTQYKQGYKTSEFWVALAAGVAQALILAFDPSEPIKGQITNLTWIALAYILGRSGLKVAQAATSGEDGDGARRPAPDKGLRWTIRRHRCSRNSSRGPLLCSSLRLSRRPRSC